MSADRTSSRRVVIVWGVLAAAGIPLPTVHAHARTFQERAHPDTEVPPKLKAILKEQLGRRAANHLGRPSCGRFSGGDSLDCVHLIMALEEEFGLYISDEIAEKFERVGDIVEYLRKRGVKTLRA